MGCLHDPSGRGQPGIMVYVAHPMLYLPSAGRGDHLWCVHPMAQPLGAVTPSSQGVRPRSPCEEHRHTSVVARATTEDGVHGMAYARWAWPAEQTTEASVRRTPMFSVLAPIVPCGGGFL
jgi:hypothetical protein